jgi:hypothetical protein
MLNIRDSPKANLTVALSRSTASKSPFVFVPEAADWQGQARNV